MKRNVIIYALLLSLLFSLPLCACDTGAKPYPSASQTLTTPSAKPSAAPTTTPKPTAKPTETPTVWPSSPLPPSNIKKSLIYEQYAKEGGSGTHEYAHHVPAINLNTKSATDLNTEINTYCMSKIDTDLIEISYYAYENDNIISLVIKLNPIYNRPSYKVYNVDKATGDKISTNDLLAKKGVSQEKFLNSAKNVIAAQFNKQAAWGTKEYQESAEYKKSYESQYAKTFSPDNINMGIPAFINEKGTLNIIPTVYGFGGASSYQYILETGL